MSKTRCIHHIVFATKRRAMTISDQHKRDLYAYIYGILQNKRCFVYRINGIANHIHMLVDIHPTIALANLVRDVKQWSNKWLKTNPDFPNFECWGEGYYAVSVGINEIDTCKKYIINQESHHCGRDILEEMEEMARTYGLTWYEDDWT